MLHLNRGSGRRCRLCRRPRTGSGGVGAGGVYVPRMEEQRWRAEIDLRKGRGKMR